METLNRQVSGNHYQKFKIQHKMRKQFDAYKPKPIIVSELMQWGLNTDTMRYEPDNITTPNTKPPEPMIINLKK